INLLQKIYHILFPTYIHCLRKHLKNCGSVLELGCGKGSPLKYVKKTFYSVGLDVHKPSIEESKKLKIHDEYVLSDVFNNNFKEKQFDCVVALDFIEHLKKGDGFKLIKIMEKIAKKKIVIFTPTGFLPQSAIEDNRHQEHISGWDVKEMKKEGFEVYGVNGWKPLRGGRAAIKWHPKLFWELISILSEPITYVFPNHAFQMFCVKKLK